MRATFCFEATGRRGLRFAAGLLAFTCAVAGACTDESSNRRERALSGAPALVLIDSVTLVEDDSTYVAEPNDLAIAPDGTFFISDRLVKRVHVFGRDGRLLRAFGRSGGGPGEFVNPFFLTFDADSLLYVVDNAEIEVFDLRDATHRGSLRAPSGLGLISVSSGRLFASRPDSARSGSVARITNDDTDLNVTGPFPFPAFMTNPGLFQMINGTALAMKGDTAATAFVVTNYVYLSDVAGRVLDSTWVPARRRNGARPDLLRRFASNPTNLELGQDAIYGASVPTDLHWMPGGKIALVSTDWGFVDSRFVDSSFVSVVDPRKDRACVDARIPGPSDPPVKVGFRGDTLFVLSQAIDGGERISATIRSYRIDTDACRWVTK